MNACECGCGQFVLARFARGHNRRLIGTRHYPVRRDWIHANADRNGMVREHVIIASRALGKPVPTDAEVHHVNGDLTNNGRGNLVLCEDHNYHMLLHARARALRECGHANWLRCMYCDQYDTPIHLTLVSTRSRQAYHRACNARAQTRYRQQKRYA